MALHLLDSQRREDDDLVDAVEELGPERLLERPLDLLFGLAALSIALVAQETQACRIG